MTHSPVSTPTLPPSPRKRVEMSLCHHTPDRVPVDFLATPEIWSKLTQHFAIESEELGDNLFFEPAREAVLERLNIDCRVFSYDMFLNPPPDALLTEAKIDWWKSPSRSTPNRMWRQALADGTFRDIWGRHSRNIQNTFGVYEEIVVNPLKQIQSIEELQGLQWPTPDWWDFSTLPELLHQLDKNNEYHIRFRVGSIFEVAWQLRGMEDFLLDLVTNPALAEYLMDRLTDVYIANLETVLELAGDRIDMIYFYDDVATQNSLLISKKIWKNSIRPRHKRIIDVAQKYGKHVMYHCDGAISFLLPELIELGINIINPIQVDANGMDPADLKQKYGQCLSFHGGIDIINTLRTGSTEDVVNEVKERVRVLGLDGGYILSSSHHIQPDTPLENILTMYDLNNRQFKP
jgi:uroporphyrinogen decarboxylase